MDTSLQHPHQRSKKCWPLDEQATDSRGAVSRNHRHTCTHTQESSRNTHTHTNTHTFTINLQVGNKIKLYIVPHLAQSNTSSDATLPQGGEILHRDYFARNNFHGGKISPPLNSKNSQLPHTHLNVQDSQIKWPLKVALVHNTTTISCPKHLRKNYGPTVCNAIGIFTALPTPLNFTGGKLCPLPER